jgi:hypothetical protein
MRRFRGFTLDEVSALMTAIEISTAAMKSEQTAKILTDLHYEMAGEFQDNNRRLEYYAKKT